MAFQVYRYGFFIFIELLNRGLVLLLLFPAFVFLLRFGCFQHAAAFQLVTADYFLADAHILFSSLSFSFDIFHAFCSFRFFTIFDSSAVQCAVL